MGSLVARPHFSTREDLMDSVAKFRSLCQNLRTVQKQWSDSAVNEVTAAVQIAAEKLFQFMEAEPVWPDDIELKRLVLKYDAFKKQWDLWQRQCDEAENQQLLAGGTRTMWTALGEMNKVQDYPFAFNATETPQELRTLPGMSYRQIAKILDWYTPNGQPDVQAVSAELASYDKDRTWTRYKPGYISESAFEKQRIIEVEWAGREGIAMLRRAEHAALHRPAPESLEDLLLLTPPPSIKQIKDILKDSQPDLTDGQIKSAALKMGVKVTKTYSPTYYDSATNLAEHEAQHEAANVEHQETYDIGESIEHGTDLDSAIMQLEASGLTCKKIAEALTAQGSYGTLSAQGVGKAISRIRASEMATEEVE